MIYFVKDFYLKYEAGNAIINIVVWLYTVVCGTDK